MNLAFEQNPSLILMDAEIKGGMDIVVDDADDTTPGGARYVDGIGFLRIIREDERLSRVPVVVMTADTEVTPSEPPAPPSSSANRWRPRR